MKDQKCEIKQNTEIARNIYMMDLACDTSEITAPGQFMNIKLAGKFLRRPISICDYDENGIKIIYKVVGEGTKQMALAHPGEKFDALLPLGNGFDIESIPDSPVLVGGGVGVPPMYALAKAISEKSPEVYLGFTHPEEVFGVDEFMEIGADVRTKIGGFITDIIPIGRYICACGPEVMLKAVDRMSVGGQYSFEARMGCGFGACMGCSCKTKHGYKRICKDGPVLRKEEIIWQI